VSADTVNNPVLHRCSELIRDQQSPADFPGTVNTIREWLFAEFGEAHASRALIDCLLESLLLHEVELCDPAGFGDFALWSCGGLSDWRRVTDDGPRA
jgi:hypothetical protein